MTRGVAHLVGDAIIPYQELLGNYDCSNTTLCRSPIIPYQELLGNYDIAAVTRNANDIIPSAQYTQNLPQIFPAGLATACGFCYNLGLLSNLGF